MPPQPQASDLTPRTSHDLLPMPFRCTSGQGGAHAVWVEAAGELDDLTAPELERALNEAAASSRLVVLDLHELTFIDSAGLHVIEDASLLALLHGRRLVVSRAPAHVARILMLTGASATIDLLDLDLVDMTSGAEATPGSRRLVG